jgi:hypothetical protein
LVIQAKDLVRKALDVEADHEDKLLLEKVLTELQQYLAAHQKTTDEAMGITGAHKAMRKVLAGR